MPRRNLSDTPIEREVERLFGVISAKRGDLCTNPVTGGEFVYGFDPIHVQKKMAYHALRVREDFASFGVSGMRAGAVVGQAIGLPHRTI